MCNAVRYKHAYMYGYVRTSRQCGACSNLPQQLRGENCQVEHTQDFVGTSTFPLQSSTVDYATGL